VQIDFRNRIIVPDHVLFRDLEGEAVLLNIDTETYFGLDDVGARMWTVLAESESIQAAFDRLLEDYEVSREVLHTDLSKLVEDLVANGLLAIGRRS
jgi:hypothetical protein